MGGGASSWRYAAAPHGAHPISRRYAHAPRANAYPFSSPRVRIVHANTQSISSLSPLDVRVHATAYSLARLRGPAARAYAHSVSRPCVRDRRGSVFAISHHRAPDVRANA